MDRKHRSLPGIFTINHRHGKRFADRVAVAARRHETGELAIRPNRLVTAGIGIFRIDFLWSTSCDTQFPDRGQSLAPLGYRLVSTDGNGQASFTWNAPIITPGFDQAYVAATATSDSGSTSEIGNCIHESAAPAGPLFTDGFE